MRSLKIIGLVFSKKLVKTLLFTFKLHFYRVHGYMFKSKNRDNNIILYTF